MKINNILKGCIILILAIGTFYLIRIEHNLSELNSKVSKFNFYSKRQLQEIRAISNKNLKDSLLNAQTIVRINGNVDAYIENTVDVNTQN